MELISVVTAFRSAWVGSWSDSKRAAERSVAIGSAMISAFSPLVVLVPVRKASLHRAWQRNPEVKIQRCCPLEFVYHRHDKVHWLVFAKVRMDDWAQRRGN